MEFDLGHNYEDAFPQDGIDKPALWTMGVIDELMTLDMVDLAGDSPLPGIEERKLYRQLKVNGYKPTLEEVRAVLNKCMVESMVPGLLMIFVTIIDSGWERLKELVRQRKEQDALNREWLSEEQINDGWTLL